MITIALYNGSDEVAYPEYKRQPAPDWSVHVDGENLGVVNATAITFPATAAGFVATGALVLHGSGKPMSRVVFREPLTAKKGEKTTPQFPPGALTILFAC